VKGFGVLASLRMTARSNNGNDNDNDNSTTTAMTTATATAMTTATADPYVWWLNRLFLSRPDLLMGG
jgi:hypothetical protein